MGARTTRNWSNEEIELLQERWGYSTVFAIAKMLGRTENAVIVKSKRLRLGAPSAAGEHLTANQASILLGVDNHTIYNYWVPKCGLKARFRVMRKEKRMLMIKLSDLVKWLEKNQDKWDSRRVALFALGTEPDWLKEKRKRDLKLPIRRHYKWTSLEDSRAIMLFKAGYNYKQIGERLGRSRQSVARRLSRLDVWGSGKYIGQKHERAIEAVR